MDQISKDLFTVPTCLDYDTVYRIFIIRQDPCCPSNTVTFGDGQNNTLDILFAVIRMHENGATILREPMVTCLTAKQQRLVFTIAGTGRYVPFSPDSMLRTLGIRTKIITKIHAHALLSAAISSIVQKRRADGKKKLTMIR
jgi:hypothetical protein